MRDDRLRLQDILAAIEQIEKYSSSGEETFRKDELIQTWTVHYLQIIGEAARSISDNVKKNYPEVPWTKVIGMRNILVHDYFGVDKEVVWNVVSRHLPTLKQQIQKAIQEY